MACISAVCTLVRIWTCWLAMVFFVEFKPNAAADDRFRFGKLQEFDGLTESMEGEDFYM